MTSSNNFLKISAFILIVISLFLASTLWDSYQMCTSTVGEIARALDPNVDSRCRDNIKRFYLFSGLGVLGLVVTLFSGSFSNSSKSRISETQQMGKDEAIEIARNRFARGEISAEEFEYIRKRLEE